MIIDYVVETFKLTGQTWLLDTGFIFPDEQDVQTLLDAAVDNLYDGVPGDRLEAGGLIVEKTEQSYDVFVRVGNYNKETNDD